MRALDVPKSSPQYSDDDAIVAPPSRSRDELIARATTTASTAARDADATGDDDADAARPPREAPRERTSPLERDDGGDEARRMTTRVSLCSARRRAASRRASRPRSRAFRDARGRAHLLRSSSSSSMRVVLARLGASRATSARAMAMLTRRSRRPACVAPRARDGDDEADDDATTETTTPSSSSSSSGSKKWFARAPSVEVDDPLLALGDATVLWVYVLYNKVSAVSIAPDFPGWLAPIDVTAQSASAFAAETCWAEVTWIAFAAACASYEIDNFKTPRVRDACAEVAKIWAIWAPTQALGSVLAHASGLTQGAKHSMLVSYLVALGVMLAWRCWAKVGSLLERSQSASTADVDDREWEEFFRIFGAVAAITMTCAMGEAVFLSGLDEL